MSHDLVEIRSTAVHHSSSFCFRSSSHFLATTQLALIFTANSAGGAYEEPLLYFTCDHAI